MPGGYLGSGRMARGDSRATRGPGRGHRDTRRPGVAPEIIFSPSSTPRCRISYHIRLWLPPATRPWPLRATVASYSYLREKDVGALDKIGLVVMLNTVERFFAKITEKRIRRGTFKSVTELESAIMHYLQNHNANPEPFVWTKSAGDILRKVARAKQALESVH